MEKNACVTLSSAILRRWKSGEWGIPSVWVKFPLLFLSNCSRRDVISGLVSPLPMSAQVCIWRHVHLWLGARCDKECWQCAKVFPPFSQLSRSGRTRWTAADCYDRHASGALLLVNRHTAAVLTHYSASRAKKWNHHFYTNLYFLNLTMNWVIFWLESWLAKLKVPQWRFCGHNSDKVPITEYISWCDHFYVYAMILYLWLVLFLFFKKNCNDRRFYILN